MSFFIVDVETDGPAPGLFSIVSFAAVKVDEELKTTFFAQTKPISDKYIAESLAISNISRIEHLAYPEPQIAILDFVKWIKLNNKDKAVFLSDNLAFDWSFINYYLHAYIGENPFGFSGRRIGDFYSGLEKDLLLSSDWKNFRVTPATHNPVDDAIGNAEAFVTICKQHNIKIPK